MTHRNAGFTLVELTLAMAFLSMLLLAIAMMIIQISSIYNKGLTLKSVNEVGQVVSSDIQRTLNASNPVRIKQVQVPNPTGGRLCAGTDVYAWNLGQHLGEANLLNVYETKDSEIRLVKFRVGSTSSPDGAEPATDYCEAVDGGGFPQIPDSATELLAEQGATLAVHGMSISPLGEGDPVLGDNSQRIYSVSMTLGTQDQGFILADGCRLPESRVDDEYCAINEFNFTARAGNIDRRATE